MVLEYIPREYADLARAWGIRAEYGNLIAFTASLIFLSTIVWLGAILSFGKLIGGNDTAKKALIVISAAIGFITAYGAAAAIVFLLSNAIYVGVLIGAIIVVISLIRALLAGVPAAEATIAEAKKLEYEAKAAMEAARRKYEEQLRLRLAVAKKIVQDLDAALDVSIKVLGEFYKNLEKNENLEENQPYYYQRLCNQISNIIAILKGAENSEDATLKYGALRKAQDELGLLAAELKPILGENNEIVQRINQIINNIKLILSRVDKDLEDLAKSHSPK